VSFGLPQALPWLLAAPVLAAALLVLHAARRKRLVAAVGPRVRALAGGSRAWRRALHPAALLFALLAVAQPLWGEGTGPRARAGMDVAICLDVSRSMLAEDVAPNRLGRAVAEIGKLCERAAGDRLALVSFAGEARLVVPLTRDLDSLARMAELQDPLGFPRGGSDLGAAIDAARAALDDGGAILLLTDGEDLEERGLRAADRARERGIQVACVGLGSELGAKIPEDGGFVKDRAGNEVVTRMDPGRLRRMAGGLFAANGDAAELYEARVRRSILAARKGGLANRYQWPLLLACLLWIVEAWTRR